MKNLILLVFASILCTLAARSQLSGVYQLKGADSIKIFKVGGSTELVLLNKTKDTSGFLYNAGNGRTEFRRALKKLNDSVFVIGPDTLRTHTSNGGGGSIGLVMPTGFSVSGTPTTNGTITVFTTLSGIIRGNGTGFVAVPKILDVDIDSLSYSKIKNKPTIVSTELDPLVGAHIKAISTGDITNWDSKQPFIPTSTTLQYYRGDKTWATLNTDVVPEGATNKYSHALGSNGQIPYNNNGVIAASTMLFTVSGTGGIFTNVTDTTAKGGIINGNNSIGLSGWSSITSGKNNAARGKFSQAFGLGNNAVASGSLYIGQYATNIVGDSTGQTSTDPLLVAGNGTADGSRSNAFSLFKNGTAIFAGLVSGVDPPNGDSTAKFATTAWAKRNISGGSGGGGEPPITLGTTSQYWRGDKSWQTLDKTAVGLPNVDNTNDLGKPISTLTQTALNGKENSITATTTADYYRGDKTFQPLNKAAVGLSVVPNVDATVRSNHTGTQTISTISDFPSQTGNNGKILTTNGTVLSWITASGIGSVTSVGLTMPTGFTVSNSPITSSGNLSVTTTLNGFIKGNGSGFSAVSSITNADIDSINFTKVYNKPNTRSGYGITDAEPTISSGSTSQYWRGDKTWQTLDKTVVGLSNVPNTNATLRSNHTGTQLFSTISDVPSLSPGVAEKILAVNANSNGYEWISMFSVRRFPTAVFSGSITASVNDLGKIVKLSGASSTTTYTIDPTNTNFRERSFVILCMDDTNPVKIIPSSGTINGRTEYQMVKYESVTVWSDFVNLFIIQ